MSLLRGVCQTPAYLAHDLGYFADEGLDVAVEVAATAWLVPGKLEAGESQFAVMPWTRVAAAEGNPFVLLCGSGHEEAAIVLQDGVAVDEVERVAVPLRGGIKDLTAMGLIRSIGWDDVEILRQPSGDGAIISFFGQGAQAASMVEPYATMMEQLGVGKVLRRTGDLWPGAPGCSLCASRAYVDAEPEVVAGVVRAFVRGAEAVVADPEQAAGIAAGYIGIHERFIAEALVRHPPRVDAIRNGDAMAEILRLMADLGYVNGTPSDVSDLSFLEAVQQGSARPA
jgi:ABC-type nitrate/sulfonate/bicarbonate transport system substrate-binding protein